MHAIYCDRICEKGTNPAKRTFAVRPFVAGHVDLGRLSDFSQICSMMSYLTHGQVSQRGEDHEQSYDSEKLVQQRRKMFLSRGAGLVITSVRSACQRAKPARARGARGHAPPPWEIFEILTF